MADITRYPFFRHLRADTDGPRAVTCARARVKHAGPAWPSGSGRSPRRWPRCRSTTASGRCCSTPAPPTSRTSPCRPPSPTGSSTRRWRRPASTSASTPDSGHWNATPAGAGRRAAHRAGPAAGARPARRHGAGRGAGPGIGAGARPGRDGASPTTPAWPRAAWPSPTCGWSPSGPSPRSSGRCRPHPRAGPAGGRPGHLRAAGAGRRARAGHRRERAAEPDRAGPARGAAGRAGGRERPPAGRPRRRPPSGSPPRRRPRSSSSWPRPRPTPTRVVGLAEAEAERPGSPPTATLDRATLLGLALRELAGNLPDIQTLTVTPDLLAPVLARLAAPGRPEQPWERGGGEPA